MDAVLEHLQEHMAIYIVAAVVVLPLTYAFRQWTFPVIFHGLEGAFYFVCLHLVLGGMVRFFQYFKSETEMESALGTAGARAPFTTPMNLDLWQRELYEPEWLFYVEIGLILAIAYVVLRMRPVNYKRKNRYTGKAGGPGSKIKKPKYSYSPE